MKNLTNHLSSGISIARTIVPLVALVGYMTLLGCQPRVDSESKPANQNPRSAQLSYYGNDNVAHEPLDQTLEETSNFNYPSDFEEHSESDFYHEKTTTQRENGKEVHFGRRGSLWYVLNSSPSKGFHSIAFTKNGFEASLGNYCYTVDPDGRTILEEHLRSDHDEQLKYVVGGAQ